MFGFDGATAIAPMEPIGMPSSEIGTHVRPGILRLPNASAHGAEIKSVRLAGMPRDAVSSSAAHRPDVAPHESRKQMSRVLTLLRKDRERRI